MPMIVPAGQFGSCVMKILVLKSHDGFMITGIATMRGEFGLSPVITGLPVRFSMAMAVSRSVTTCEMRRFVAFCDSHLIQALCDSTPLAEMVESNDTAFCTLPEMDDSA